MEIVIQSVELPSSVVLAKGARDPRRLVQDRLLKLVLEEGEVTILTGHKLSVERMLSMGSNTFLRGTLSGGKYQLSERVGDSEFKAPGLLDIPDGAYVELEVRTVLGL